MIPSLIVSKYPHHPNQFHRYLESFLLHNDIATLDSSILYDIGPMFSLNPPHLTFGLRSKIPKNRICKCRIFKLTQLLLYYLFGSVCCQINNDSVLLKNFQKLNDFLQLFRKLSELDDQFLWQVHCPAFECSFWVPFESHAWAAQCKKLQILKCFKQFFFTIPKFENRLALIG